MVAGAILVAAGCVSNDGPAGPNSPVYRNVDYGVQMRYPANLKVAHSFAGDYLLSPWWNPDTDEGVPGEALLSLTLPASNQLMDARLRLGASDDTAAAARCSLPDKFSVPRIGSRSTTSVGGLMFTRVDVGDEGMNHFLDRHSYRTTHNGNCYAVDLVVSGVNPGVYGDNRRPPMTRKQAFKRLTVLLDGLSFSPP